MTDAITPEFSTPIPEEAQEQQEKISQRDHELADLMRHSGFLAFFEEMKQLRDYHRQMRFMDTTNVPNMEALGQQFLVSTRVADILDTLIKRVEEVHERVSRSNAG